MSALVDHFFSAAAAPDASRTLRPSLVGLTRTGLAEALARVGVPERELKMRVAQLWHWIYFQGATSFDAMLNVSKVLRATLADAYTLGRPEVVTEQVSQDGTRKWLIQLAPHPQDRTAGGRGAEVECVYIPESDRGTLCISSQVGLHAHLRLLSYGYAEARPQPHRGRDRRAGRGRPRSAR